MNHKLAWLFIPILSTLACTHQQPASSIRNLHQLCRKDKADADVVARMQQLGLNLDKEESRFIEPKSRTDFRYVYIALNPQTGKNIQGIHVKWPKSPGLSYEEIQELAGISLPKRGAKEIRIGEDLGNTWFYVLGNENAKNPDLSQVTVTCTKNNYDQCWAIDINCYGFVHE